MCCPEPDDVQYDLSLYGCDQIIKFNEFWVVFALPSTTMLFYDCLWRPPVTNSAIVSPPSLIHAVLTVAVPGEALILTVSIEAWHARGRRFADNIEKNVPVFLHFYFGAFCYFLEAKLFHYIFLKMCMCEVIQLLYSNDQYPFNGQMRIPPTVAHSIALLAGDTGLAYLRNGGQSADNPDFTVCIILCVYRAGLILGR